jgi:hypothetical protein
MGSAARRSKQERTMKRVLVFDGPKAAKRFDLCMTAIMMAGDGKGTRDRETIRKEARLLDAFDSISVCPDPAVDAGTRILKEPGPLTITLRADDHSLLTHYLDTTQWTPKASREACDVQDWADAAEKIDA